MAKKLCICKVCGRQFDRNAEQAVIAGPRRYAHLSCMPDGEPVPMDAPKIDPELTKLNDYIKVIYGDKANYSLINKQIKRFHNELGYSYSGILKSLTYFYEVKHNTIEKSNGGIGIVEYVYQDAYQYYLGIFLAQQQNENKTFVQQVKEYLFKPRKSKVISAKELDWGEEDLEDEN